MKRNYGLSVVAICLLVFTSACTSKNNNNTGAPLESKLVLNLEPDVSISKKKVSGEATVQVALGIFAWGVSNTSDDPAFNGAKSSVVSLDPLNKVSVAKAGAFYNACEKAGADFIASPQYTINVTNYFSIYKIITCKVEGFPGKINSVEVVKATK